MSKLFTILAKRKEGGFSLVELMVVVAIIGILAALAVPRFQNFQAKAKQSEAKTNLGHIYTLEQSYFGDNDNFVALAACGANGTACITASPKLGFDVNGKSRYIYSTTAVAATGFTAAANAVDLNTIKSNCSATDQWQINDLNATTNVADCSKL